MDAGGGGAPARRRPRRGSARRAAAALRGRRRGRRRRPGRLTPPPADPAARGAVLYSAVGRAAATASPRLHHALDAARGTDPAAPRDRQGTPVNVLDEIVKDQLRSDIPELAPGDTVKVAAKVVEGNRERDPGLRGDRPPPHRRRDHPLRHRPAHRVGRRRRADVQDQQPADRADRGRAPRRRPPGEALLPPQARRQGGDAPRAAPELTRGPAPGRSAARPTARGPVAATGPRRFPVRFARDGPAPCPTLRRERALWRAGRGPRRRASTRSGVAPACGPVVAAAVIVRPNAPPDPRASATRRRSRRPSARRSTRRSGAAPSPSGVGAASVAEIDRLNIYHATHLAMRRALARLGGHDHVLVDGLRIAGFEGEVGPYDAIVDGDAPRLLDRLRLDRGEGRARPAHGPPRGAPPGLRLGAQRRLRDAPSTARRWPSSGVTRVPPALVHHDAAGDRGRRAARPRPRRPSGRRPRGRRRLVVGPGAAPPTADDLRAAWEADRRRVQARGDRRAERGRARRRRGWPDAPRDGRGARCHADAGPAGRATRPRTRSRPRLRGGRLA